MKKPDKKILDFVNSQLTRPGYGDQFLENARQHLRERCKTDYWWFCHHVLGMEDIDNELHHEMCHRWNKRRHRLYTMWLVPRKHLKTSLWTVGDTLYEALLEPNIRQLIICAKLSLAIEILNIIKNKVETQPLFRWLWPEFCLDLAPRDVKERCKWSQQRLDWPCRTNWQIGGSVEVMAVEATRTGRHFDILRYEDIIDEENVPTKEYRDKVYTWFKNSWQIRHSPIDSRMRVIGTRWHYDDLYGRELKAEALSREEMHQKGEKVKPWLLFYRRKALEDGKSIWPERFPPDVLAHMKRGLGNYIFSCQYLNEPANPEDAIFKREDINYVWEEDLYNVDVSNFAAVDLAVEDKEKSDYTAIVVASFDSKGKMYVRQIIRERMLPSDALKTIQRVVEKWQVQRIGIETTAFQSAILDYYKRELSSAGVYIPWSEVKRGSTGKFKRWLAIQPLVERGDFHVVRGIENSAWLEEEMTTLTPSHMPAHDDILDALSDTYHLSFSAPPPAEPLPPPDCFQVVTEKWFGPMFEGVEYGGNSWE